MPHHIRLYIRDCLLGFALGIIFSSVLVMLNVANLQHLIDNVSGGWLAFFLLCFFHGIVFSGVQFAITVMRMAGTEPEEDDVTGPPQP